MVNDVMMNADAGRRIDPCLYPLIVHVHVPKTAGTTVRTILAVCSPFGRDGVEFSSNDRQPFDDIARKSDWIAGHVLRDDLARRLIWLNRPVEYFSRVRDPLRQLLSHLNFSFERYSWQNYHNSFSLEEQRLDADVMATDFSNPVAIMALLFRHADLFLNNQSHLVLGSDFADLSDDEVEVKLTSYAYVASEDDLPELYRAFGFAQLPEGVDEVRKNIAKRYYLQSPIFESPQLREFLARHHKHDFRLYAAVRRASWRARARKPFRPAFIGNEIFTQENFEEQSYLESNPDVAAEVESGRLKSGRTHFDLYGCHENRTKRRWVFPGSERSESPLTTADFLATSALTRLRELREQRQRIAGHSHRG